MRVSEKTCADIKATGDEQDVLISVHAPYFINLNADAEEWPKSRKRLMDAAHFGNLAGATDIIFHPGSYFGQPPEKVLPGAIERLAGCVEELRAAGNPVTLRPETMGKSAMLGSLEDTLEMSKAFPGVAPCLDFAHLHARPGDGTMNTYDEWRRAGGVWQRAGARRPWKTCTATCRGSNTPAKGKKNTCHCPKSDLDLQALLPRPAGISLWGQDPDRKPGDGRGCAVGDARRGWS